MKAELRKVVDPTFGRRLAEFRDKQRLSQNELARLTATTQQSVYNYESDRSLPKIDFLIKLVIQFPELSIKWLLLGDGDTYVNGKHYSDPSMSKGDKRKQDQWLSQENAMLKEQVRLLQDFNKVLKKQLEDK